MKRWRSYRAVLGFSLLLLLLGGSIAWVNVTHFESDEYQRFEDQSFQLARVFARAAGAWLDRDNEDVLEGAADLLLAGSGQYIRIELRNELVLDEREDGFSEVPERLALSMPRAEMSSELSLRKPGRLDILVGLSLPSAPRSGTGSIQIGFSNDAVNRRVRSHRLLVVGLTLGAWLISLLLGLLIVRWVQGARSHERDGSEDVSLLRCGELTINCDTHDVELFGKSVQLTPKMFDLLAFLARNPEKTYSDDDLLSELWADSSYATSADVKQCIYMLRRRLRMAHPDPKQLIVNVKGFGYTLVPPVENPLSDE